ncbi:MAG: hypothetical protein A2Z29_06705 [Chloroflexi bacterium RBG_16_56_11]|nr:MAG: hypothetical protein A2Z29_06705 [Chloroflexi bacterium RBG_16_56_11]
MKIGLLEIVLIIAVVIALALVTRVVRMGNNLAPAKTTASGNGSIQKRNPLTWTGVILIVAGIIGLAAAASLFRLILQSYLWSLLIIAAGFIMLRLSRRKG